MAHFWTACLLTLREKEFVVIFGKWEKKAREFFNIIIVQFKQKFITIAHELSWHSG